MRRRNRESPEYLLLGRLRSCSFSTRVEDEPERHGSAEESGLYCAGQEDEEDRRAEVQLKTLLA